MNFADWIDIGATPPQRLPDDLDAAIAYASDALGHVAYLRWTLALVKRRFPSLADAKAAKPTMMWLLLDQSAAIEYWDRGRARVVSVDDAPAPGAVLMRVLRAHARRFKCGEAALPAATNSERIQEPMSLVGGLPLALRTWFARAGRFAAVASATNTLGVGDDAQAVALFLRDRASRSPHTARAYLTEIRRLAAWCIAHELGPLTQLAPGPMAAQLAIYLGFVHYRILGVIQRRTKNGEARYVVTIVQDGQTQRLILAEDGKLISSRPAGDDEEDDD
ncbi:hypothetical protein QZM22_24870 [Burkholderia oklahomensis]|nr:hypothetical protein [Burkholderia oklahomensis]MDN7675648.1 hypothetical protein [Burkholderia oklahomensis]